MSTDPAPNLVVGDCRSTGSRPQTALQTLHFKPAGTQKLCTAARPHAVHKFGVLLGRPDVFGYLLKDYQGRNMVPRGVLLAFKEPNWVPKGVPQAPKNCAQPRAHMLCTNLASFLKAFGSPRGPKDTYSGQQSSAPGGMSGSIASSTNLPVAFWE